MINLDEILESISDLELNFAIKEIKDLDDTNKEIKDTMSLNNICSNLLEVLPELDQNILFLLILKEYSYRKAGLK